MVIINLIISLKYEEYFLYAYVILFIFSAFVFLKNIKKWTKISFVMKKLDLGVVIPTRNRSSMIYKTIKELAKIVSFLKKLLL